MVIENKGYVCFKKMCGVLDIPLGLFVGKVERKCGLMMWCGYSTADTCTMHGDVFIFPDEPVADLRRYTTVTGRVVDAGSTVTSLLCQECNGCV